MKEKDNFASVSVSTIKINAQIADYRIQNFQKFDVVTKTRRSEILNQDLLINPLPFR